MVTKPKVPVSRSRSQTPEEKFVAARRRLKLPYKPEHVTEEEVRQAVAQLPK